MRKTPFCVAVSFVQSAQRVVDRRFASVSIRRSRLSFSERAPAAVPLSAPASIGELVVSDARASLAAPASSRAAEDPGGSTLVVAAPHARTHDATSEWPRAPLIPRKGCPTKNDLATAARAVFERFGATALRDRDSDAQRTTGSAIFVRFTAFLFSHCMTSSFSIEAGSAHARGSSNLR